MRRLVVIALGAAGAVVTLATAAVMLGEPGGTLVSYGAVSPGAAVLELLAGAALFASAALLATDVRRGWVAACTFVLALSWSAAVWAGWLDAPTHLRGVAILLVPAVAPLSLLTVAALLDPGKARRAAVGLGMFTLAGDVVLWLTRDPFFDVDCWRDCAADTPVPFADAEWARTLTDATVALGAVCGAAIVLLGLGELLDRRPARRARAWAFAPAIVLGSVLVATGMTLALEPAEDPERPLYSGLFAARALGLTLFAAGLAVVALRPRFVRGAIARLAGEPGRPAGGDLGTALAEAFGDPSLRIGYPLTGDGRVVDGAGQPVEIGPEALRIVRGGDVVALVGAGDGAPDSATLDRGLGPAARLALANERLRAEQLARLHELVETRRRIVATGDATRRRLERDLHDGAQQRLLALTFDLRVALNRAEASGEAEAVTTVREALEQALEQATEAIEELRSVAHGIFPAVLTTSGLVAALETLADAAPLTLTLELDDGRTYPPEIEAAAYAVVAEAVTGAVQPVRVAVTQRDSDLVVTTDDAPWKGGVVSVEDRVGAVGGSVSRAGRRLEAVFPPPPG